MARFGPGLLFAVFWLAFVASWFVAAFWRAPSTVRSTSRVVFLHRFLVVCGFVLLNYRLSRLLHAHRLWGMTRVGAYVLALLMLPGFTFAWWARLHLGRLWSANVVRKADHRVVDTGPYRVVRHPIYTGILFAALMTAAVEATWVAFAGVALATLGFWVKARDEERFLSEQLEPGAYQTYRARVPMLIPFGPG